MPALDSPALARLVVCTDVWSADPMAGPATYVRPVMSRAPEQLYELIDEIEIAMMTTRRADGHLQSRPMANQKRAAGADLWFVTADDSQKLRDLAADPHVNLSYYRDGDNSWVSVAGTAAISRDRAKIHELYAPDWKAWFASEDASEGDPRHGTPDDPRMVLIGVTVHAATFLDIEKPRPVVLYEVVKGWITGTPPDIGETRDVVEPRRPM